MPAAAALLGASVLLSRVLGYLREALLAYYFGATGPADSYYAAFQLPDLLNHFLAAGALSIAFLPLYTQVRERSEEEANRLMAVMLGNLGVLAAVATAALVLGPFGCPWIDARRRLPLRVRLAPRHPGFRRYLWLALPVVAGFTLLTVDEWYVRWFGGAIGIGSIALLSYARRLAQAPVAVIGQAVAAAAQPALANLWAAGRGAELDRVLGTTLRSVLSLGVLAGAGLLALAGPSVTIVYQHGAFTGEDAQRVARLLAVSCAAVPAWVVQQVAVRAFYARSDTWRPMVLGSLLALGALPLYLGFGRWLGVTGIATAGAVAMGANALATLGYARWCYGGPALAPIAASGARALLVATPAALVASACLGGRTGTLGALADLAIGGAVFAATAGAGIAVFGDAAMREPMRRVGARLARRGSPAA